MNLPFSVTHSPSGDLAEAPDEEAAVVAARTLLDDHSRSGHCVIHRGAAWVDMVWADDPSMYTHVQKGN
jgi:hypothetical protein